MDKRFGRRPLKQKWEIGLIVEGALIDTGFDSVDDDAAHDAILAHTEMGRLISLEKTYGDLQ